VEIRAMPRLVHRTPKYSLHRATGQAVVTIAGQDHYLGVYKSERSRSEYDRLIAEWIANGRQASRVDNGATVGEIILAFWQHAQNYYRKPVINPDDTAKVNAAGVPVTELTGEVVNFQQVLRVLRKLYESTPAADFGPLKVQVVLEAMIQRDWSRTNINRHLSRLKHVFKWAASKELIPGSVYESVRTVPGLKMFRTNAREMDKKKPVPTELIAPVRQAVSSHVRGMIDLQLACGARPGEICGMRIGQIDMSNPSLWVYRPPYHKTAHHGHKRTIYFGRKAQNVLREFLRGDATAFVFSPAEADRKRREARHAKRKTPLTCGNVPGSNATRQPCKQPGERYTVRAYTKAIKYACQRAFKMPDQLKEPKAKAAKAADTPVAKAARAELRREWRKQHCWSPHRLRHNFGTWARAEYGLEVSMLLLGQTTIKAAEIYAERNEARAQKIMNEVG
jgi:integrase